VFKTNIAQRTETGQEFKFKYTIIPEKGSSLFIFFMLHETVSMEVYLSTNVSTVILRPSLLCDIQDPHCALSTLKIFEVALKI
jgi:hypothetical protein